MTIVGRQSGKYSPSEGIVLPAEAFTGVPGIPCPDVCDLARSWWASWATSGYAHHFGAVEWQDLHDTALLMDRFYEDGNSPRHMAEATKHMANLFGLGTRARLHISQERPEADLSAAVRKPRADPRLKSA